MRPGLSSVSLTPPKLLTQPSSLDHKQGTREKLLTRKTAGTSSPRCREPREGKGIPREHASLGARAGDKAERAGVSQKHADPSD